MQERHLHIDVDQLWRVLLKRVARSCFAGKMLTQINGRDRMI
jgi:hypothetical protein